MCNTWKINTEIAGFDLKSVSLSGQARSNLWQV